MSSSITPGDSQEPPAHPLAIDLAALLAPRTEPQRVLILGIGSGRNVPPLANAGVSIDILEADIPRARDAAIRYAAQPRTRVARGSYGGPYAFTGGFTAALSTHALLHGATREIERAVAAIANRLGPGGLLYATFGSTRDPRFAEGTALEPFVSAPRDGNERGVPHAYFDETRLRALLAAFAIDRLDERSAAESVGRWAHDASDASSMMHWFVRAAKR